MPNNIFISYSHQDEIWKNSVVKYLNSLGDRSVIDVWDDRLIRAGDKWLQEIKQAIQEAKIAILLVSVDFLTSEFILKEEIPDLLKRRQEEGIRIIPLIIRSCAWKRRLPWLNETLARPKDAKPLNLYTPAKQDEILNQFAEEILSLLPEPDTNDQPTEDEANYEYQAKRFGMGYRFFNVKCDIEKDGAASVIRTVELEAYSLISVIDTVINIPEQDPDGKYRDIEIGKIISFDQHKLTLDPVDKKPGQISAKINIKPALMPGEKLKYQVSDYYLGKGLFAIGLTPDEHSKRKEPADYFGWHITRPTKSFVLQVQFPFGNCPKESWHEVRYGTSSTVPDKGIQIGEQSRLKGPENNPLIDPDNLRLEVNFPLSGMVYIIGWKPL